LKGCPELKAVILCGGRGSRLNPLTENTPKALIKILNRPVLDSVIEKIVHSGISEIYLSLGYMADEITEYCSKKEYGAELIFCCENKPLGTAGGVKNCIKICDDDILIINGECVFDFDLQELIDFHYTTDSDFTVCGIETDDPRDCCMISYDDDSSITAFSEKTTWEQTEGNFVDTGIYVMKGALLEKIPDDTGYDFTENLFPAI
jgi:NDP-sugar pyrophosphorylase family protein